MIDYWEVNDKVVSSLGRRLEDKRDRELVKDYKELKQSPGSDFSANDIIGYYITFSILPAVTTLILTIGITLIKPNYIQILIEQLGLHIDLPTQLIGALLSIFNFVTTLVGLTNIINFRLNRKVEGRPNRTLQNRHIKNLSSNFDRHGGVNIYKLMGGKGANPVLRAAFRNFKMEPIGTNILYPYIIDLHKSEMKKRGINPNDSQYN